MGAGRKGIRIAARQSSSLVKEPERNDFRASAGVRREGVVGSSRPSARVLRAQLGGRESGDLAPTSVHDDLRC